MVLAKNAESLPLDQEATPDLAATLREFATLVDDTKRDEGEGRGSDDLASSGEGTRAVQYLRAVERAASDRLSRVRRDEALQAVLGPVLARGDVTALADRDGAWLTAPGDEDDDTDDDTDSVQERVHARDVLTQGGE